MNIFKRIYINYALNRDAKKVGLKRQTSNETNQQRNIELLKELLANPRVEGIIINIEKLGAVEETNINAKLKEL